MVQTTRAQPVSFPVKTLFVWLGGILRLLRKFPWIDDIRNELAGPKGWKALGEALVGASVVWGVLIAVMTYQSQHLLERRDRAERSYYQLITDLGHDSVRVRIGAISRIPEVMLRQIPQLEDVRPLEAMRLTFGAKTPTSPAYHHDVQRLIRIHISTLNAGNKSWNLQELQAILDMLATLGSEGWYDARPRANHVKRADALAWLWENRPESTQLDSAATLLRSVKLDGLNLQQFDLADADFSDSSLNDIILKYAKLDHSRLQGATLTRADLSLASLKYAQMDHADLTHAYLTSADMESASLKYAILNDAQLQEVKCSNCYLLQTSLTHANLRKIDFTSANLQNSNLDNVYAAGAILSHADLDFSSLIGANLSNADLRSANLSRTTLRNADLRSAFLSGTNFDAADLTEADLSLVHDLVGINSCFDTNIAGIKGLSTHDLEYLIQRGAIVIPNSEKWTSYKELGRPHNQWREFSKP